jgi:hypothetical protein
MKEVTFVRAVFKVADNGCKYKPLKMNLNRKQQLILTDNRY